MLWPAASSKCFCGFCLLFIQVIDRIFFSEALAVNFSTPLFVFKLWNLQNIHTQTLSNKIFQSKLVCFLVCLGIFLIPARNKIDNRFLVGFMKVGMKGLENYP